MYNLFKEFDYCKDILDSLHINYARNISIRPNTRIKRKWGVCRRNPALGYYIIDINADLLDERNDLDKGLRSTIFHELLHTVSGCFNHGTQWKQVADVVSKSTGCPITVTSTVEEKGMVYKTEPHYSHQYIVLCPVCKHEWTYKRACKTVKNAQHYICPYCNHTGLSVKQMG